MHLENRPYSSQLLIPVPRTLSLTTPVLPCATSSVFHFSRPVTGRWTEGERVQREFQDVPFRQTLSEPVPRRESRRPTRLEPTVVAPRLGRLRPEVATLLDREPTLRTEGVQSTRTQTRVRRCPRNLPLREEDDFPLRSSRPTPSGQGPNPTLVPGMTPFPVCRTDTPSRTTVGGPNRGLGRHKESTEVFVEGP